MLGLIAGFEHLNNLDHKKSMHPNGNLALFGKLYGIAGQNDLTTNILNMKAFVAF